MGHMKDFDRRIRNGGDDAIAAVAELWEAREKILFDITDAFTKARWIPVEERLPEEGVRVLVFDKAFRQPEMGTYYAADGWGGDEIAMLDPTHWMPLPEPPEVK